MPPRIPQDEYDRIVALLHEHGGNRSRVAAECSRSKSLIQGIAVREGIPSPNGHMTKRATEASAAIRNVDRMGVIFEILHTGQGLLKDVTEPRDYKDVVTGLAIGIDKHRLETGEVTNRTENRSSDDSLEKAFRELDASLEAEVKEEGSP